MNESRRQRQTSHVAIAAIAAAAVVIGALVLVSISGHARQHPGALLMTVLGIPTLFVLLIVIAIRRREPADVR